MLKKIFIYSLFLCISVFCFSACGASVQTDESGGAGENSPEVIGCTVNAGCDGGEDDQYVDVAIRFDRNVRYSSGLADDLRIVIGGERIKTDDINVSQDSASPDAVKLRISINKVTNGVLEITPANGGSTVSSVTDESGKYSAKAPDIKKLIPSGVTIEQESSSEAGVQPEWTKIKVTSPPSHRSMVWIQLMENGEPVEPDDLSSPDIMDDTAAGIHEHEFLWATDESVAEDIAKAVNDFYGERFTAESAGSEVTVTAKDSGDEGGAQHGGGDASGLMLKIYEY